MGRILLTTLFLCAGTAAAAEVFDPAKPHTIDIRLSARAWDLLQPGHARKHVKEDATVEEARAAGVSLRSSSDFAYVLADVTFDNDRMPDAGLRFKGNSTYSASRDSLRRPMKLDFDRFHEKGRFQKLESLNLSNTVFDPSQSREAVAFSVYRALGVPAPRTGHAIVHLSVEGKHDRESLGLYTLIEEVDNHFLKQHFSNNTGTLFKPSGMRGLAYLGEDWRTYERIYKPENEAPPATRQKIIDLARLIHRSDDSTFRAKIGEFLHIDNFLRYVAATAAVISFDSFTSTGHNYYLYHNPTDGLIHFIPWDMNMSFGGYSWLGTEEELARTSITRAYADHNLLIERVLAIPEHAASYRRHMRKIADEILSTSAMQDRRRQMESILTTARAAGRADNPTTRPAMGLGVQPPELWPFIDARAASIRAQLDGKDAGFKPEFTNPHRNLAEWAGYTIPANHIMRGLDTSNDRRLTYTEVTTAIHNLFAAPLDHTATIAAIDKILPPDLRTRIPSKSWADWLFSIADADKDNRLASDELLATYRRHQPGSDPDRDQMMDQRELIEALQSARAPRDPHPTR